MSFRRETLFFAFAMLLALVVWFLTNLANEYSGTISVPVIAESNIDGHKGESSNIVVVSARCRTSGFRLVNQSRAREQKPVRVKFASSDLRRTGPDTWSVIGSTKNSYINQFFGDGAAVEAFISDTLSFDFARENNKKVPVEVPVFAQFRSQYMQSGRFKVVPDSVTVYADDAILESIEKINASRIVLNNLDESVHGSVKLNVPKGVRLSQDQVNYTMPVSRYVELKGTFPVEVWNAPAGHDLQVFPTSVTVVMRCAFPLGKDPLKTMKVYVDYRDFAASRSGKCIPRTVKLSSEVLDIRFSPEVLDCIEIR